MPLFFFSSCLKTYHPSTNPISQEPLFHGGASLVVPKWVEEFENGDQWNSVRQGADGLWVLCLLSLSGFRWWGLKFQGQTGLCTRAWWQARNVMCVCVGGELTQSFFLRSVLYGTNNKNSHCLIYLLQKSNTLSIRWDNLVGMTNGYVLDDWGSNSGRSKGFFSIPHIPDRLWGSPSFLSSGYWGLLAWGKALWLLTLI
jgi:hypothetical protein